MAIFTATEKIYQRSEVAVKDNRADKNQRNSENRDSKSFYRD